MDHGTAALIGIGGAGGNILNSLVQWGLDGLVAVAVDTDWQALSLSSTPHKVQLGRTITRGLGTGSHPDIGRAAAEASVDDLRKVLHGFRAIVIIAGMGGGTGSGAAPVIAHLARKIGIQTVGIVTTPFDFEGVDRIARAQEGISQLSNNVDSLFTIANQNLFKVANENTTFGAAFEIIAKEVLSFVYEMKVQWDIQPSPQQIRINPLAPALVLSRHADGSVAGQKLNKPASAFVTEPPHQTESKNKRGKVRLALWVSLLSLAFLGLLLYGVATQDPRSGERPICDILRTMSTDALVFRGASGREYPIQDQSLAAVKAEELQKNDCKP